MSDGSLYPAKAGLLARRVEPGAGPPRHVLNLTKGGRARLLERLRTPAEIEITDLGRFLTILAFLSQLPDTRDQHAVLRRRLAFIDRDASFFYDGDRPLRAEEMTDPYRRGMCLIARTFSSAERAWLRQTLGLKQRSAGSEPGVPHHEVSRPRGS